MQAQVCAKHEAHEGKSVFNSDYSHKGKHRCRQRNHDSVPAYPPSFAQRKEKKLLLKEKASRHALVNFLHGKNMLCIVIRARAPTSANHRRHLFIRKTALVKIDLRRAEIMSFITGQDLRTPGIL
jgi:hypothetical protein